MIGTWLLLRTRSCRSRLRGQSTRYRRNPGKEYSFVLDWATESTADVARHISGQEYYCINDKHGTGAEESSSHWRVGELARRHEAAAAAAAVHTLNHLLGWHSISAGVKKGLSFGDMRNQIRFIMQSFPFLYILSKFKHVAANAVPSRRFCSLSVEKRKRDPFDNQVLLAPMVGQISKARPRPCTLSRRLVSVMFFF